MDEEIKATVEFAESGVMVWPEARRSEVVVAIEVEGEPVIKVRLDVDDAKTLHRQLESAIGQCEGELCLLRDEMKRMIGPR